LGKFDTYKVDLKSLSPGVNKLEYLLENKFFTDIDGPEVRKGKVKVYLSVKRAPMVFEMDFRMEGVVYVPCDRCLDDLELPVESKNRLVVKFGKEYAEESDVIVVIPEEEGAINLAWFLYEFVALTVPMKHIHPTGKCNKTMSAKLKKHVARSSDDEDAYDDASVEADDIITDDEPSGTDPRWDSLRGLMDNDNN
jgi:uncharacterized metal-binding protein YceD (DUF177 family)